MGIGNIGIPSLILILVIALLIFGPNRLPEMGSAFGRTLSEFKKSVNGVMDDEEKDKDSKEKEE